MDPITTRHSTLEEVEAFLVSFLDTCLRNGVRLVTSGAWRLGQCQCLIAELVYRAGLGHLSIYRFPELAAKLLGVPSCHGLWQGWDAGKGLTELNPWFVMGVRLRARYDAARPASKSKDG